MCVCLFWRVGSDDATFLPSRPFKLSREHGQQTTALLYFTNQDNPGKYQCIFYYCELSGFEQGAERTAAVL